MHTAFKHPLLDFLATVVIPESEISQSIQSYLAATQNIEFHQKNKENPFYQKRLRASFGLGLTVQALAELLQSSKDFELASQYLLGVNLKQVPPEPFFLNGFLFVLNKVITPREESLVLQYYQRVSLIRIKLMRLMSGASLIDNQEVTV